MNAMKDLTMTKLLLGLLYSLVAGCLSSCSNDEPEQSGNPDESKYVDLGLSVKWAKCNIDANSPEEIGSYFAWGETATKTEYSESNYFDKSYSKFKNSGKKIICGTTNDIATKRLGKSWQMPTKKQIDELVNNLEWSYTTINGQEVLEGIASNGNSIIFPITGMYAGSSIQSKSQGCYWGGELYANANDNSKASMFSFFKGQSPRSSNYYRYEGMAIRPVYVDDSENSGSGGSSASSSKVEVASISIGSKDKQGRYSVTIKVKASNLSSGESVKTIGAKWGTVKAHPDYRDSRSGASSASFTSAWHTGTKYYVTPFIKTNKTSGEVDGKTVTKKTP